VAAAVDYDLVSSPQYGSLTRHLQAKIIKARRRSLSRQLGIEDGPMALEPPEIAFASGTPGQLSPEEKAQREVEGGVIIVGRNTLKEYMEGLRRGWMCGVAKYDREAQVKALVEADGLFDLPPAPETLDTQPVEPVAPVADAQTPPPAQKPLGLGALPFMNKPALTSPLPQPSAPTVDPETLIPESAHIPPTHLPTQPPMLLLPWMNHLGFKQVPWMFIGLFNEREKYREGGEAAMKLIFGGQRAFQGASSEMAADIPAESMASTASTDLDFDLEVEDFYKKSFNDTPNRIAKLRETYYSTLQTRLETARELASGSRERTKDEIAKPPMTEEELKAERLKKELRWRNEEEGYEIIKKGSGVAWDARWKGWLKVYTAPEEQL
jgi:import inner membrane translocase subunit TIM54